MAKRKGESITTINRRLRNLYEDPNFGPQSEEYQLAKEYIQDRVKDDYLFTNKAGVLQVRQTKEAKEDTAILGKSNVLKEYVPTSKEMYSQAFDVWKEQYDKADLVENPLKNVKKSEAIKDPMVQRYLAGIVHEITANLSDYDSVVDNVYRVRDNDWNAEFAAEAQALLDDRSKSRDWVSEARDLVRRFDEAEEAYIRELEEAGKL